jgi:hypothetical protein
MRLGNLSGTKTTIQKPVISLQANHKFTFSAMAMVLLGLEEGSRFDFFYETETESLFVAKIESKTEGRAVSKLGKSQHPAIHSFLSDNDQGQLSIWEVTSETIVSEEILWNKVVLMEAPIKEAAKAVSESSSDVSNESIERAEVSVEATKATDSEEKTVEEQNEESVDNGNQIGDDF